MSRLPKTEAGRVHFAWLTMITIMFLVFLVYRVMYSIRTGEWFWTVSVILFYLVGSALALWSAKGTKKGE